MAKFFFVVYLKQKLFTVYQSFQKFRAGFNGRCLGSFSLQNFQIEWNVKLCSMRTFNITFGPFATKPFASTKMERVLLVGKFPELFVNKESK